MAVSKGFCDPCSRDDKSTVGVKVCIDCGDTLCAACLKAHGLFKAFTSHHLVDAGVLPSSVILKTNEFCDAHPEKILDLFCTQHESFCCRSCMVEKHRTCQSVLPIEDASKNVDESSLLADTPTSLHGIINTLDQIDENQKSNSAKIKKEVKDINDAVTKLKSQALKKIDEAEKKILKELREIEAKQTKEMDVDAKEVRNMRETTQKYMNEFDVTTKLGSKNKKFILLQTLRSKIQSLERDLHHKATSLKSTTITFSQSTNLMSSLESFGSLKTNLDPCSLVHNIEKHKQAQVMHTPNKMPPNFKLDREIKIKNVCVSSIAVTQDTICMCNSHGTEMLVYNKDYEKQSTCSLSGNPWDIALIPGSDLAAVTLPNLKSIQFIKISRMEAAAGKTILVPRKDNIQSIAATSDRLFLGGVGQICVTDLDCNLIKIIKTTGGRILYLHIDDNKNLYCSVYGEKCVTCIDADGKAIYICQDEAFTYVVGITTDLQGNVYIVDRGNYCIHMLSSDGTYKGKVLQDYTFKYAWDICYDKKLRKMYISHSSGETVSVFNLL